MKEEKIMSRNPTAPPAPPRVKDIPIHDSVKGGYNGPRSQDTRPTPPPKPPAKN